MEKDKISEKIITFVDKVIEIEKNTPNDYELGKELRKLIREIKNVKL